MYKQQKRRKIEKPVSEKPSKLPVKLPPNINQLPEDILYEIFQHLSVSDRQAAGLVCKKWFDVSKHNVFLRNCVIKIQNREFREERIAKNGVIPCTMKLFAKSKRQFTNFELSHIDLNQKTSQNAYAKGMAKRIRRLAIYKCKVKLPILDAMLETSPNLRNLEFDNLDRCVTMAWELTMQMSDYVPPITEVTHLKWHDSEAFISKRIFQYLLAVCPKLESIDLSAGLQHFCSPMCLVMHMNSEASRATLNGDEFVNFLELFGPQLKAIAIDELNKPYPYITSLVQYGDVLQLDELRLTNSQVAIDDLNEILESQKTLKVLHLCNTMINGTTMQIIAKMTELQELKLQQQCLVNDVDIKQIKSLRKLKSLELHAFSALANDGFKSGLVESEFGDIETLVFSGLCNITSDVFVQCITKFNHLKVLKLMQCSRFVTNDIMQTIFEHLVQLEELECEDATKVGNIGFLGRNKHSSFPITRLGNLRRANFTGMSRLNDRMLRTITNQTLQHLDISCCRNITNEGVKALLHQLPSLEVLDLNGNPQISTRIMNYAVNHDCAPRLKDILMQCRSENYRL